MEWHKSPDVPYHLEPTIFARTVSRLSSDVIPGILSCHAGRIPVPLCDDSILVEQCLEVFL